MSAHLPTPPALLVRGTLLMCPRADSGPRAGTGPGKDSISGPSSVWLPSASPKSGAGEAVMSCGCAHAAPQPLIASHAEPAPAPLGCKNSGTETAPLPSASASAPPHHVQGSSTNIPNLPSATKRNILVEGVPAHGTRQAPSFQPKPVWHSMEA